MENGVPNKERLNSAIARDNTAWFKYRNLLPIPLFVAKTRITKAFPIAATKAINMIIHIKIQNVATLSPYQCEPKS